MGDDERLHIELVRRGGERDKSRETRRRASPSKSVPWDGAGSGCLATRCLVGLFWGQGTRSSLPKAHDASRKRRPWEAQPGLAGSNQRDVLGRAQVAA